MAHGLCPIRTAFEYADRKPAIAQIKEIDLHLPSSFANPWKESIAGMPLRFAKQHQPVLGQVVPQAAFHCYPDVRIVNDVASNDPGEAFLKSGVRRPSKVPYATAIHPIPCVKSTDQERRGGRIGEGDRRPNHRSSDTGPAISTSDFQNL